MFTFITQLGAYELDYDEVSKYITLHGSSSIVTYAGYVELEALIRGEKVTWYILDRLAQTLNPASELKTTGMREGRSMKIQCQDGDVSPACTIETLSRHFVLFRDFFTEYPDKDTISIPTVPHDDVVAVLNALFEWDHQYLSLTDDLVYTLYTLNPINNAYFLLFNDITLTQASTTTLITLLSRVSQEEKEAIIAGSRVREEEEQAYVVRKLPLPQDVALLASTRQGRRYLATEKGHTLTEHRGWAFCNAVDYCETSLATKLIKSDFSKDKYVPLTFLEMNIVSDCLREYMIQLGQEEDRDCLILACTMLGIHHESLGNVDKKAYPPYRVHIAKKNYNRLEDDIRQALLHYGYDVPRDLGESAHRDAAITARLLSMLNMQEEPEIGEEVDT
jgi:hypothetical protein